MTRLLWFVCGVAVAISGQAVAQTYFNYSDGTSGVITENGVGSGSYHYSDSRGRLGTFYGPSVPALPSLRPPC
jgi:hypothetical protein